MVRLLQPLHSGMFLRSTRLEGGRDGRSVARSCSRRNVPAFGGHDSGRLLRRIAK